MINEAHCIKQMVQHKGAGQGTNMFKGTISKVMSIKRKAQTEGSKCLKERAQGADQWINFARSMDRIKSKCSKEHAQGARQRTAQVDRLVQYWLAASTHVCTCQD